MLTSVSVIQPRNSQIARKSSMSLISGVPVSAMSNGRVVRCQPRSASFHNLVLMHEVFAGDILTDFPFIEASFGLSVAGVAL